MQTNSPVNNAQISKNDLKNFTAIKLYETSKSVDLKEFDDHPLSMLITKEKVTDWQKIFSKTQI